MQLAIYNAILHSSLNPAIRSQSVPIPSEQLVEGYKELERDYTVLHNGIQPIPTAILKSHHNLCTKRPGNIEPDEDIYHVHFKPYKIQRHPYKQKYCVIHINGYLFRKMLNRNQMLCVTGTCVLL